MTTDTFATIKTHCRLLKKMRPESLTTFDKELIALLEEYERIVAALAGGHVLPDYEATDWGTA